MKYKVVRDIRYAIYQCKLRIVARFMLKHKTWWNAGDEKRWREILNGATNS